MNKLKTSDNGGQPIVLDDLRFEQNAVRDAFKGLLSGFQISNCNLSCVITRFDWYFSVTAGYVCIDKEIYYVPAHSLSILDTQTAIWQVVSTWDSEGLKSYYNGVNHDTYEIRRAMLVADVADSTLPNYNLPSLKDIIVNYTQPQLTSLNNSLISLQTSINSINSYLFEENWHYVGASGEPAFGAYTNVSNNQPLRFKKHLGYLIIEGCIHCTADGSGLIFTLPAGYRPITNRHVIYATIFDASENTFGGSNIIIDKNGAVSTAVWNGDYLTIYVRIKLD